jgi:hypothetical protein
MTRHEEAEGMFALDVVHNATVYLAGQFQMEMTPDEARDNLQARAILVTAGIRRCREIEEEIFA